MSKLSAPDLARASFRRISFSLSQCQDVSRNCNRSFRVAILSYHALCERSAMPNRPTIHNGRCEKIRKAGAKTLAQEPKKVLHHLSFSHELQQQRSPDRERPTAIPIMAFQSAGDRVANIPELLEHILDMSEDERISRREDVRTLLLAQGVSLAFRNTIIGSKKIRHKLFLVAPSIIFKGGPDWLHNPLLRQGTHIGAPDGPVTLSWVCCGDEARDGYAMLFVEFGLEDAKKVHEATPNASWRKMYLRKTKYKVRSIKVEPEAGPVRSVELTKANPTAGEIYDAAFPTNSP